MGLCDQCIAAVNQTDPTESGAMLGESCRRAAVGDAADRGLATGCSLRWPRVVLVERIRFQLPTE